MISLIEWMIKEEWRMHTELFGVKKFVLFPLVIFTVSSIMVLALTAYGVSFEQLQFLIHFLMLFFGLNVGVIGFVSKTSMDNLLGDKNLLVYSSRLLPFKKSFLLLNFILKDFIFYFILFILPLLISNLFYGSLTVLPILTVSYLLSFGLGLGATFLFSSVYSKISSSKPALFSLAVLIIAAVYSFNISLEALNLGYSFFLEPSLNSFLFNSTVIIGLMFLGGVFHSFKESKEVVTKNDFFQKISNKLGSLISKDFLDIRRSSGGFGKILVTYGVLGGVFWFMVDKLPFSQLFLREQLLSFSTFLGISSLSVYNWINRYDKKGLYYILPLTEKEVLASKIKTFFLIISPLLIAANLVGFYIFGGGLLVLVHALLISFISATYVLAVVVKLTGLNPNVKLLDATVITKFLLMCFIILELFLLGGIFYPDYPFRVSIFFVSMYFITGGISYSMLRKNF